MLDIVQAVHIDHVASPDVAGVSKETRSSRLLQLIGSALSCAGGVIGKALQYILNCCAWAKRHPLKAVALLLGFTVGVAGLVCGYCTIPQCGIQATMPVSTASGLLLSLALLASYMLNPTQLQISKLDDDLKGERRQIRKLKHDLKVEQKARQAQNERLEARIEEEAARAESR